MLKSITGLDLINLRKDSFTMPQWFTWGLGEEMDKIMPLLEKGRLCVFSGAAGSGKTTWSFEMALQNAEKGVKEGFGVGYLSLEVAPLRPVQRYGERAAGMDKLDKMYGMVDVIAEDRAIPFNAAIERIINSNLLIVPDNEESAGKISYIESICANESGPAVLFIDNLAEIDPEKNIIGEYDKYDYIIRSLLDIAKNTDTTIVLLHHTAKIKEGDKQTVNTIKGNNIIVTKADIVVAINQIKILNPNWKFKDLNREEDPVEDRVRNAVMAKAPKLDVRAIEIFKDRDWDERGVKGYLYLDGAITKARTQYEYKNDFPLLPEQQLLFDKLLEKYKLIAK